MGEPPPKFAVIVFIYWVNFVLSSASVNPSKPTSWYGRSAGSLLKAFVTCIGLEGTCPQTVELSTGADIVGVGKPFSNSRLPSLKTSSEIFPRLKYNDPPALAVF